MIKPEAAPGVPVFKDDVEIGRVVADRYPEVVFIEGGAYKLHTAGGRDEGQEPPTYHLRGVYVGAASMWPGAMKLLEEHGVRL